MSKSAEKSLGYFCPEEIPPVGQAPFGVCYTSTTGTPATEYAWNQIGQSAGK